MKPFFFVVTLSLITVAALTSCSRFHNSPTDSADARYVVISPIYNEIIWALGAQDKVVGVDLSTTYPPEVKKVQTVGYHRALSAEGILSLHPTAIKKVRDFADAPDVVTVDVVHDLNLAARFADHIVLLNHGRVVATGTPSEVLTAHHIRDVFRVEPTFIPVKHSNVHLVFD